MTSTRKATLSPEKTKELNEILGFDEKEPSGSLAPMEANEGKWTKGVDANALSDLAQIATSITDTIEDTVQTVARARMKIGKLLNEAREKFPGDNEFGKWRKACLPHLAGSTCNQYQRMAAEFKNAPAVVEAIGWNVAAELMNSPDLRVKAWERATDDERPNMTVKEAREEKKAKQDSHSTSSEKKPSPPAPEQIISSTKRKENADQLLTRILDRNTKGRIEAVLEGELDDFDDYSKSAIIFGFGPSLCDQKPNMDVWLVIYDTVTLDLDPEDQRIVDQAYSKMKEAWG